MPPTYVSRAIFQADHIFRPPKPPPGEEPDLVEQEYYLLKDVAQSVRKFFAKNKDVDRSLSAKITKMLDTWVSATNVAGIIEASVLQESIIQMETGDCIALYISRQNAMLLIRRSASCMTIETCGVTPHSRWAFQSAGRIQCMFPSQRAMQFPTETIKNGSAAQELAELCTLLSMETMESTLEKTKKGTSEVPESRQKPNPVLVTEMLLDILSQDGKIIMPNLVLKRIQDDSVINKRRIPWRRSAMYTSIRVACQLLALHLLPKKQARTVFKNLVLCIASDLLDRSIEHGLTSMDTLQLGKKTLDRKAIKLASSILPGVRDWKNKSTANAQTHLEALWHKTRSDIVTKNPNIRTTEQSPFTTLRARLAGARLRNTEGLRAKGQTFGDLKGGSLLKYDNRGIPSKSVVENANLSVLFELETWVHKVMPKLKLGDNVDLSALASKYLRRAKVLYGGLPEQLSVMYLTYSEMWMMGDAIVLNLNPLMAKFPPGISEKALEDLILKDAMGLERLQIFERYIRMRQQQAEPGNPSDFDRPCSKSYAIQAYDASPRLQGLRSEIEIRAAASRKAKVREWQQKSEDAPRNKENYYRLLDEGHTHSRYVSRGETICHPDCVLCSEKTKFTIGVFEWPFSKNQIDLKMAVFEVGRNRSYSAWRDFTHEFLSLGMSAPKKGRQVHRTLVKIAGLQVFEELAGFGGSWDQEVTLGSWTKTFYTTHYRSVELPAKLESVLLDSALHLELTFGPGLWIADQTPGPSLISLCSAKLLEPYRSLQNTRSAKGLSSEVIATRCDPPGNLSSQKYSAFGTMRTYEPLRLMNLRNILYAHPEFLNDPLFQMAFTQTLLQAGSGGSDDIFRETHGLMAEVAFTAELLGLIEKLVATVCDCGEELLVSSLILVVLRIISLSNSATIKSRALEVLETLRTIVYSWLQHAVQHKAQILKDTGSKEASTVLRLAYLVRSTFDIDSTELEDALAPGKGLDILLQCTAIAYQNSPVYSRELPTELRRLMLKDLRLSHGISRSLGVIATKFTDATSKTLGKFLPTGFITKAWAHQKETHSIRSTIRYESTESTLVFDTCSGSLMVADRDIGPLPQRYRCTNTYRRLFGSDVVHVSSSEYMHYRSCEPVSGSILYFSLSQDELIVRAGPVDGTTDENRLTEFVPSSFFENSLPKSLADSTAAWADLGKSSVNFRPWNARWDSSVVAWNLKLDDERQYAMTNQETRLVAVDTLCTCKYARSLRPMDSWNNMFVTEVNGKRLFKLSRYNLSFSVNKFGRLECHELKLQIAEDQGIGTLFGLQSYLLLESMDKGPNRSRVLIIPDGEEVTRRESNHIEIEIVPKKDRKDAGYHLYYFDNHLKCLKSKTLASELLLIWLHAVTSGALPDPFTGRTGTDEALARLSQKSLTPSSPFPVALKPFLERIMKITPHQKHYPLDLKDMREVQYNEHMSPLAQDERFSILISKLVMRSNKLQSRLAGTPEPMDFDEHGDSKLLNWTLVKNAWIRSPEFGAEVTPVDIYPPQDRLYNLFDKKTNSSWLQKSQDCLSLMRMIKTGKLDTSLPGSAWLDRVVFPREMSFGQVDASFDTIISSSLSLPIFSTISERMDIKLRKHWLGLYQKLRNFNLNSLNDLYHLKFLLGCMCYGSNDVKDIMILAEVALSGKYTDLEPPDHQSYDPGEGFELKELELERILRSYFYGPWTTSVTNRKLSGRQEQIREERSLSQLRNLARNLVTEYLRHPQRLPPFPDQTSTMDCLLDYPGAKSAYRFYSRTVAANKALKSHIDEVDRRLSSVASTKIRRDPISQQRSQKEKKEPRETKFFIAPLLSSAFKNDPGDIKQPPEVLAFKEELEAETSRLPCAEEFMNVMGHLTTQPATARDEYKSTLVRSFAAYEKLPRQRGHNEIPDDALMTIRKSLDVWMVYTTYLWNLICAAVNEKNEDSIWPSPVPRSILMLIASSSADQIASGWKDLILLYAKAITNIQRLERLATSALSGDTELFFKEAHNPGHVNWQTMGFPDWAYCQFVLLEIEKNALIRPDQLRVALEMSKFDSCRNRIYQIEMAFGKSSIVTPMIVILLTGGGLPQKLVRVMVPKPLFGAMRDSLQRSLGGLVNKSTHCTPVVRDSPKRKQDLMALDSLWNKCRNSGGVMVVQPDDVQSFKLQVLEIATEDPELGAWALRMHEDWEKNTRTIIDEADIILGPNSQLVYTLGNKVPLEGGSMRWVVPQQLLELAEKNAHTLQDSLHSGLRPEHQAGFPKINLNKKENIEKLLSLIVTDISAGHLACFDLKKVDQKYVTACQRFIKLKAVSRQDRDVISEGFQSDRTAMEVLYILRCHLAHGILINGLRLRNQVDFGLNLKRTNTAVPYLAKGLPRTSAKYEHPDIEILLTILAYREDGLTLSQMVCATQSMLNRPDREEIIAVWNKYSNIPLSLRNLKLIAFRVEKQSSEMWSKLRHNRSMIDFFLSAEVFPKTCHEYSSKISSSAWDIPSSIVIGTTGFTGTADNASLMPSSIKQQELGDFEHVMAKQAATLLRQDNQSFSSISGECDPTTEVLRIAVNQTPALQVLIDVAALITDKSNRELAQNWLAMQPEAEAAVFFNDEHEAVVLSRENTIRMLVNSKYEDKGSLDKCLIFFDQVHARGTDLKLPAHFKAGVTLGNNMTNLDEVLQGCMRMRSLESTQSVMFIGTPQVRAEIMDRTGGNIEPCSSGVLIWCIENTLAKNDAMRGTHKSQGDLYKAREELIEKFLKHSQSASVIQNFKTVVIEKSSFSLEERYGPVAQDIGTNTLVEVQVEIEQETQIEKEQQVQQVQDPRKPQPLMPIIDEELLKFIESGASALSGPDAFLDPWSSFEETSNALGIVPVKPRLRASRGFMMGTVELDPGDSPQNFLRSAQWVLSSVEQLGDSSRQLVLISDHESAKLMNQIRASKKVVLHDWRPRTRLDSIAIQDPLLSTAFGEKLDICDDLMLRFELMMFSGQLYFESLAQAKQFQSFLQGFFREEHAQAKRPQGSKDPRLSFLRRVLEIRSGREIDYTHMGKLCTGRELNLDDFKPTEGRADEGQGGSGGADGLRELEETRSREDRVHGLEEEDRLESVTKKRRIG